jgi:hypothetical protein
MTALGGRAAAGSSPRPQRRPNGRTLADAAWLLGLVAALLAFWHLRIVRPGREPMFGYATDWWWYWLPSHRYLAERLRDVSLPAWNPYQGAGQPFLATLQPGTFYPGRWLHLVFDVPTAMHVSLVAHVVLTLVAMYGLCRQISSSRIGAAAGAAVFVGAFTIPNVYSPAFLEPGAWLPVGALALVRLARERRWRWSVLLGTSVAMPVLAGGYQMALFELYGLALLGLGLALDGGLRPTEPATLVRLAVAGILACGTAAPQLVPTIAWASSTARPPSPLTDEQIMMWPMSAWDAARVIFWPRDWSPYYLSLPAAAFGALGFARGGVLGVVLGIGALAVLLVALGSGTPAFVLYRVLPGLAMFRQPRRLVAVLAFVCAIGAAIGIESLGKMVRDPRHGRVLGLLALTLLIATLFGPVRNRAQLPWTVPSSGTVDGPAGFVGALQRATGDGRAYLPATLSITAGTKLGTLHHVRVLQDYEPLSSRRLADYLHAISGLPPPAPSDRAPFLGYMRGPFGIVHPTLLDLVGIRSVVLQHPRQPPEREPPFVRVFDAEEFALYTNPQALPRAFTVARARFVDDEAAALVSLVGGAFDARRESVLVGRPDGSEELALTTAQATDARPARIVVDLPERVAVDVDVAAPAVLVLADAFAPGWEVRVDGVLRRIRQANHFVRGVVVRPGERRAEFVYRTPGLRLGLAIAVASWVLSGFAVVITRRRDRIPSRATA